VKRLFRTFEQAGERAKSTESKTATAIVRELSRHAAIEEQVFYPAVRQEVPDMSDEVLESLEEHHVVKWLCSEIERLSPDDERFTPKMTVLIDNVRHHIREEEETLFPAVRHALNRKRLAELGELLEQAKGRAPTHPHPRMPSTPPANLAAAMVTGAVDKARDVGEKAGPRPVGRRDDPLDAERDPSTTWRRSVRRVFDDGQVDELGRAFEDLCHRRPGRLQVLLAAWIALTLARFVFTLEEHDVVDPAGVLVVPKGHRAQQTGVGLLSGTQLLVQTRQIPFLARLQAHGDQLCPHGRILSLVNGCVSITPMAPWHRVHRHARLPTPDRPHP